MNPPRQDGLVPAAHVSLAPTDPNLTTGQDSAVAAAEPPAPAGRYELLHEIARGGMGAVFRATDATLGREVAVKVLQEKFAPGSGAAGRFSDEARITAQLQHPGIPPVHDLGMLPDGRPFLAMKLIKGDTLEDLLKARPEPAVDRGRFVAVFEQVCQAVAYAHAHSVIHRDLKPANVMVGAFGEVQVMDWGLAKVLAERGGPAADPEQTSAGTQVVSLRDSDGQFTQAGSVLGTPAFMPPEQAAGAVGKVDARSDVFGLGAVLAVILTGRPPFEQGSAETTRVKAATGDVGDCFARLDGCGADPELVALCKRCLSPRQADRPADAGEVAAAVAALRTAAEERARTAELERVRAESEKAAAEARAEQEASTRRLAEEKAAEQRKRRRVQRVLFAAALLVLLTGGALAWWQAARLGRNAEAVSALLDQAEGALRRGDADRTELALGAARRRASEGGAGELAGRMERLGEDLALLRQLDAIDRFRWTPKDNNYPDVKEAAASYRAALAAYGADPDEVGPEAVVARARDSAVRGRLVEALDWLLAADRSPRVREALRVADLDDFRDAVRDAVVARDAAKLRALAGSREATEQPAGFVAVLGVSTALPVDARRRLLGAAAATRRGSLGLLMALGMTYPINQEQGAEERARWFQAATAAAPENPAAHNNLGNALRDKQDPDGAIACFKEAIRLDPKYAMAHYNLGVILCDKKDLDGAIASYKEAIRLDPKDAWAHNNLGVILRDKKDPDGAVASFEEAIRLDPKHALAHSNLGNALRDKGDLDGAVASCKEAIRLDPKLTLAHNNLGNALRNKKDPDGAIASYKEAIRLDPKYALAHSNLGNALRDKKNLDGAVASCKEAIRLDPKLALAHNGLGNVLSDSRDLQGAEAAYREAIRLDPKFAWAHNNLGIVLRDRGDRAGAEAEFREAIRLDPSIALAHNNLGWLLELKVDPDGAVAAYRRVLEIEPKDPFALAALPRAERMRQLLLRLPAVVAGEESPKTPAEACEFARLCALPSQKRYAAAARLFERAFADDPNVARDLTAAHRYFAATAAARAARGEGADAPAGSAERSALRSKTLAWLRADLALRRRQAASADPAQRNSAAYALGYWLADANLSGVRDPEALQGLPGEERTRWRQLWATVDVALAEARKPPPPPELLPPPDVEPQSAKGEDEI